MDKTMQNKICLVTGATSGIGYFTALELAKMGAVVVIGGRDMEKAANTVIKIRSESENPYVDFLLGDLSDFSEIRKFADEFIAKYERLDVLVNNAGAIFKEYDANPDRVEMTMALNFFGIYLLTGLLLERLYSSKPSRVINVSSMVHQIGKNDFSAYNDEESFKSIQAYAQSKLALMHYTYLLAAKLEGTGITVNAMHPGWVKSNFGSDFYKGFYGIINTLFKPIQSTPAQGADTIIYLASSKDVETITGKYFIKRKVNRSSPASFEKNIASELWNMAETSCRYKYDFDRIFSINKEEQNTTIQDSKNTPSEDKLME